MNPVPDIMPRHRFGRLTPRTLALASCLVALHTTSLSAQPARRDRPLGTLREQAALQQGWLERRMATFR